MAPAGDSSRCKGIACLVCSAFGFALMGMFVRLADDFGAALPALQKSFFRNLVALAVAAAMFVRRRPERVLSLPRDGISVLVLRSVFGTLGIVGNFYALSHIPVGDAMTLNKLAPFFTVVFSGLFLGERVTARQLACIAGAFAGALFIVKPEFSGTPPLPALCGLLGGLFAGAAYTCVRGLGRMRVDGAFIVLFFSAFSCVATSPSLFAGYVPMTAAQAWILVGAGASATLGQFGVTAAYRLAAPREIAVYDYTNIVFALLLGFFVFGQAPDAMSWAGIAAILASAVAMYWKRS